MWSLGVVLDDMAREMLDKGYLSLAEYDEAYHCTDLRKASKLITTAFDKYLHDVYTKRWGHEPPANWLTPSEGG